MHLSKACLEQKQPLEDNTHSEVEGMSEERENSTCVPIDDMKRTRVDLSLSFPDESRLVVYETGSAKIIFIAKDAIAQLSAGDLRERISRIRGKESFDQINILGDDGVPISYHDAYWKGELIDFGLLQQDAFDSIDKATPMERQQYMLNLILKICRTEFNFDNFGEVQDCYKKMINLIKQINFSPFKSEKFNEFQDQLITIIDQWRANH